MRADGVITRNFASTTQNSTRDQGLVYDTAIYILKVG